MTEDERKELKELKADIEAKTAQAEKLQAEIKKHKARGPKTAEGRARSLAALAKAHAAKRARKERLASPEVVGFQEDDAISDTRIKQIEEEERKKINAKKRKQREEDLRAAIARRLEQEMGVTEAEETIFIELGGNKHNAGATYIAIDGVRYQADRTYKVRAKVAEYMRDLMQNCDSHQCEIEGNSRRYNRLRNTRMGPLQTQTPNSALLRV